MAPYKRTLCLLVSFFLLSCSTPLTKGLTDTERALALKKISFDTSKIDENGLIGPPDGQVLIAYAFRISIDRGRQKEINRIDPSVRFYKRPGDDTYMCIGEGATEDVLIKLASLPYIVRIDRFYGE